MNCLDAVVSIADQLFSASSVLFEITQDSTLKLISASDDGVCSVLGLMHSVRFGMSARCACFLKKQTDFCTFKMLKNTYYMYFNYITFAKFDFIIQLI